MKIKLNKEQLGGLAPAQWLRRAGYALIYDRHSGQESFARRFGRDFYPRFHLYVHQSDNSETLFFNLHLDHKKASYAGQTRHSADYDGDLVEQEAKRLQSLLTPLERVETSVKMNTAKEEKINKGENLSPDVLNRMSPGNLDDLPVIKKKSFWQKLFS